MMPTWTVHLRRDGNGNLTIVGPETPPDWVNDLIGDVTYRFRESPGATHIALVIDGTETIQESTPDAATGTPADTTGQPGAGAASDADPTAGQLAPDS